MQKYPYIKTFKELGKWEILKTHNQILFLTAFIVIFSFFGYFLLHQNHFLGFFTAIIAQIITSVMLFKKHYSFKGDISHNSQHIQMMANFFEHSAEASFLESNNHILINSKLEEIHNLLLNNNESNSIHNTITKIFSNTSSEKNILKTFFNADFFGEKFYKHNFTENAIFNKLSNIIQGENLKVTLRNHNEPFFNFLSVNHYNAMHLHEAFNLLNIGIYELDNEGNFTFSNEYFANLLGYTPQELYKQSAKLQDFLANQLSAENIRGELTGNWQNIISLRTNLNEEITLLITHKVVFSNNHKVEKIIGYAVKISSNALLSAQPVNDETWINNAWQCFFHDTSLPIAIINKEQNIIKYNSLFDNEVSLKDIKLFHEYFDEESEKKILQEFEKFSHNTAYQSIPFQVKLKDSEKILELYILLIKNLKGEFYGYLTRLLDVTSQIQLQEQFTHSQRMQTVGYFAGSIAHDFNNLLTIILGYCDLLLDKHSANDPSYNSIIQIKQSSDRAANLISRLLAFSRQQTMKPEVVDLNEIFAGYYNLIQRLIGEDIIFKQNIKNNLWFIEVDRLQLEQVILNLVVNSKHAMENCSTKNLLITVENIEFTKGDTLIKGMFTPEKDVLNNGNYVKIEIKDSGIGMKKQILTQIFEPFFSTKEKNSGTGLGLSTVFGIVKQSDGHIYVKSKENHGTTFLLLFERTYKKPQIKKVEKESTANALQKRTNNILLLEDEEGIASFAITALESKGYTITHFTSGAEALKYLNNNEVEFDLVISDVVMPEMSGPEFIKKIQGKYQFEVIFISGYGEDVFNKEFGKSRDFHIVQKPFSIKSLINKIDSVLHNEDNKVA